MDFERVRPWEGCAALGAQVIPRQALVFVLVEKMRLELTVGSKLVTTTRATIRLLTGMYPLKMTQKKGMCSRVPSDAVFTETVTE